jgi:Mg-chelatase subunit ChlD
MNLDKLLNRSHIMGWELRAGIESFAHHSASALGLSGINIVWNGYITTAAINQYGQMYLTNVNDDARINRALFLRYVGFVIHELLHRKYTNFVAVTLGDSYVARFHNAVEDIWIERQGIKSGLVGNITNVLTELIGGMVIDALKEVNDWADPRQYPFALAVTGRRYAPPVPLAKGLKKIFAEASNKIDDCKDSFDTLDVARWVIDQLQMPENQADDSQGEGQDGGEDGGEGEGQGEREGAEGPGGPADGPAEGPGEGDTPGGGYSDPIADAPDAGDRRCPDRHQRARAVEPALDPGTARCHAEFKTALIKRDGHHLNQNPAYSVECKMSARLRTEVKRLFDNTGTTEFQRGRRAGSLDAGKIHSIAAGNDRVFMRRQDIAGVDSAVVIMLDLSSSMDDYAKIRYAIPACAALVETLTAAGVDVCVTGFADAISIIKPWNMPAKKALNVLPRVVVYGGTADAAALRHAHDLLLRHPARRRVCFAITDGIGDIENARNQVNAGTALGITTIGVGILHTVSNVYSQSVRVDTLEDLGNMIFKHIKLAA